MTRGEFAIIAATILVVLAVFLWIAVDKIEGIEPGCIVGGCGVYERSAGNPPLKVMPLRAVRTGRCPVQAGRTMASRCNSGPSPTSLAFAPAGVCVVAGDSALATGYEPKSEGGPGGLLAENRTGRAAEREVPSAASARLPRADAKLAQARLVCFRVTAYCPCEKCCSAQFADGITASGTRADHPLVAAPLEFPFGTVMMIPGYGTVKVEDRGGAIKGDRLDVFFPTHEEALEWGVRWLDVELIKGVPQCPNRK